MIYKYTYIYTYVVYDLYRLYIAMFYISIHIYIYIWLGVGEKHPNFPLAPSRACRGDAESLGSPGWLTNKMLLSENRVLQVMVIWLVALTILKI